MASLEERRTAHREEKERKKEENKKKGQQFQVVRSPIVSPAPSPIAPIGPRPASMPPRLLHADQQHEEDQEEVGGEEMCWNCVQHCSIQVQTS